MAIKISGCNVIDDNRCLVNISSIDANTKTAIENSGIGGEPYPEKTARDIITAGDIVVMPMTDSAGDPVEPSYVYKAINPQYINDCTTYYEELPCCCCCVAYCGSQAFNTRWQMEFSFACNRSCVVNVNLFSSAYTGNGVSCNPNLSDPGLICIRGATVDSDGTLSPYTEISCTTFVCATGFCILGRPLGCTISTFECSCFAANTQQNVYRQYVVESCSGSKAFIAIPWNHCFSAPSEGKYCGIYGWTEIKLCYCDVTNLVSVISYASICERCGCSFTTPMCGDYTQNMQKTPDGEYTIYTTFSQPLCQDNRTVCCTSFDVKVLKNDDNLCLLDRTPSCMVCGPVGGLKSFLGPNNCFVAACTLRITRKNPSYNQSMITGGMMFNTYGLDGWIMAHLNVEMSKAPCCTCLNCQEQKYFAFRPVAHNCYEVTCNALCGRALSALGCTEIRFVRVSDVVSCAAGEMFDTCFCSGGLWRTTRSFDIGNCTKVLISARGTACCCLGAEYVFNCFCIGTNRCICYRGGEYWTGVAKVAGLSCPSCIIASFVNSACGATDCDPGGLLCNDSNLIFNGGLTSDEDPLFTKYSIPLCRACCCMVWASATSIHFITMGQPPRADVLPGSKVLVGNFGCYQCCQVRAAWACPGISNLSCFTDNNRIIVWNNYLDPTLCFTTTYCNGIGGACPINCACNDIDWTPVKGISFNYINNSQISTLWCPCFIASNCYTSDPAYAYPLQTPNGYFASAFYPAGSHPNGGWYGTMCRYHSISWFDNTISTPNTSCFYGIAQNDAAIGETVRVAIPGTIDFSPFASTTFPAFLSLCDIQAGDCRRTNNCTRVFLGGECPFPANCFIRYRCGIDLKIHTTNKTGCKFMTMSYVQSCC